MRTGGEVKIRPYKLKKLCPKSPGEASVPVTHNGPREALILDHRFKG